MKTLTVTFRTERFGIQTDIGPEGQPVVNLGTRKREDYPQPYVALDPLNPPDIDFGGIISDAILIQTLHYPDFRNGYMGFDLAKDTTGNLGSLLIRANTRDHIHSGVVPHRKDAKKLQLKGIGFEDPINPNKTNWSDSMHTLADGEALDLIKHNPQHGKNKGNILVNIDGVLYQITINKAKYIHYNSGEARRVLEAIVDPTSAEIKEVRDAKVAFMFKALFESDSDG